MSEPTKSGTPREQLARLLCAENVERYHGRRVPHPHREDDTEMFYDEPWTRYDWSTGNPHPTGTVVPSQRETRGYCDYHNEMAVRFAARGVRVAVDRVSPAPERCFVCGDGMWWSAQMGAWLCMGCATPATLRERAEHAISPEARTRYEAAARREGEHT